MIMPSNAPIRRTVWLVEVVGEKDLEAEEEEKAWREPEEGSVMTRNPVGDVAACWWRW